MISMRYWLPANAAFMLGLRPLRFGGPGSFEHLEHAVGDEESADHVAGRGNDGDHPEHGREAALPLADQYDRAHNGNGIKRVGERHQRRVQQRRDMADDLEADESCEHEYEEGVDEVGHGILGRWSIVASRSGLICHPERSGWSAKRSAHEVEGSLS